ncbi:DUF294 nucleotidyltransferase-like domain-containing protein [Photobacterium sanguinicancri]|uniref:DUF294 nucleotidyltransferase-like domain-containing protein n=1 Tax=Photobacterium sanguinicancri TaxID=875932 RepID=UPI0021C3C4AD|nr:DUF294 nucleotidyltransferase-like domain-containing protein [Photobacterium sanguinicancri]
MMDSTLLPNIVAFLGAIEPFNQLPNAVLDSIAINMEIQFLGKGESLAPLLTQKQNLFIIRSGVIEQRLPDGSLRSRLGEKDIFGFSLENENYQANALENSLIYRFDYAALLHCVADYPIVTEQLALSANRRLQSSVNVQWSEGEKGLFFKSVKEVASTRIVQVPPSMTIQEVARLMRHETGCSCAVIVDNSSLNNTLVGMVTDKDMTKRVVADAVDVTLPITHVMTEHPWTVGNDELVLSAVHVMMKHNIQNVPVLDANKQVVGLITPQLLVQKHSVQAVFLIEKIGRCQSLEELTALALERQAIFEAMAEANLPSHLIGQVLTMIYDAFTQRLIYIAEKALGPIPCRYVWLAAGSHARSEIHLLSDQDNALVLENNATDSDRVYFNHFAMYVCKGLAECGYALCTGRFMAATPKWCQPLNVWLQYYRKWANNPEYDMLLSLTVFLEIRPLAGDNTLFDILEKQRVVQVKGNTRLISALVRNALQTRPPLGIFNNLVLEKEGKNGKRLNIKKAAIGHLVDLARIYALHDGGEMLATEARLRFALDHQSINESSYQDLSGTYQYMMQLRYSHHLRCLRSGKPLSNTLNPDHFGSFSRQHLKDAFRIVSGFQDAVKMKFGA